MHMEVSRSAYGRLAVTGCEGVLLLIHQGRAEEAGSTADWVCGG